MPQGSHKKIGCWVTGILIHTQAYHSNVPLSEIYSAARLEELGSGFRSHFSPPTASRAEAVFKPAMQPFLFRGRIIPATPTLPLGDDFCLTFEPYRDGVTKEEENCSHTVTRGLNASHVYNHGRALCSLSQHPGVH